MTNFGVRAFLEKFLEMAPKPSPKGSSEGPVEPLSPNFSGFIFKIQANMDPKHRDRIAFLRIVSGAYEPGIMVNHSRLAREIKLTPPQQFFAQERKAADRAFAGDIVGIYNPGLFSIGDSLTEGKAFEFEGIPSFAPEHFTVVRTKSALKRKQLIKGLVQLSQEGSVQILADENRAASDPILAAVGVLQFDVVLFRLQNEYNVDCVLEPLAFRHARWTNATDEEIVAACDKTDAQVVRDVAGNALFLFKNEFNLNYFLQQCPNISLFNSNAKLRGNMMKIPSAIFEA